MTALLQEIISLLYGGLTSMATAFGQGMNSIITSLFIDNSSGTMQLSNFGGITIVLAAVALSIGLGRWVLNFVTSLGARNR